MRILAIGNFQIVKKQLGFTLIELLISTVILGIFASLAILSISSVLNESVKVEAERLVHILEVQRAQSKLRGGPTIFEVNEKGYRIFDIKSEVVIDIHEWKEGVNADSVSLILGPEPIIPPQKITLRGDGHETIVIRSDGVRPFSISQ